MKLYAELLKWCQENPNVLLILTKFRELFNVYLQGI
jgi:hypothetical protein